MCACWGFARKNNARDSFACPDLHIKNLRGRVHPRKDCSLGLSTHTHTHLPIHPVLSFLGFPTSLSLLVPHVWVCCVPHVSVYWVPHVSQFVGFPTSLSLLGSPTSLSLLGSPRISLLGFPRLSVCWVPHVSQFVGSPRLLVFVRHVWAFVGFFTS